MIHDRPAPEVPDRIDWPRLAHLCDRLAVPATRVSDDGQPHLIRNPRDLADFEAANPTTTTEGLNR